MLFLCDNENVYLIKRSESMPIHSGQIAFVGGHKHVHEIDPWIVAQREYEEETSLARDTIEFCGYLPAILTSRLRPIVPVMTKLLIPAQEFIASARSNGEWDDIIAYPWKELVVEANWEFGWRSGFTRRPVMFHTIHSKTFISPNGNIQPHLLWGATAGIIWDFLRLYFKSETGSY